MSEVTLSDKLKIIMKKKKWTQTRLALALSVSPQRLNTYYNNKNAPTVDWLKESIEKLYQECL